ncbi:aminotransferase-like domain-containing protein [Blastococcus sp. SYSU D00820]
MDDDRTGVDATSLAALLGQWSTGRGSLQVQLERALLRALRRGDLPPGTRLPPERTLASALRVSRGTLATVYDALRDQGWLDSRQGSGTWVRVDAPRPLAVVTDPVGPAARARWLSSRLIDAGDDVVDLSVSAVWDMDPLPDEVFAAPTREQLLADGAGHGYQPLGSPRLRALIARMYAQAGAATSPEQVLVTTGAQQALALAAAATLRPGDAVVVESATYPGAIDALARAGARLVAVPPEGEWASVQVLRDAVERSGARMAYLMPACSNPGGRVMREGRRRALAELFDGLGAYLFADDALDPLPLPGGPRPLAAFDRAGRVLTAASLSKVAWAGLRVGWLRAPEEVVARVARTRAASDYGMSLLTQSVAAAVLERAESLTSARRAVLTERRELVRTLVARLLPSWRCAPADSGLSLWVRLPAGDADTFLQYAYRHAVTVTPGSVHSVDDSVLDHIRISCTQPPDVLQEGVSRLARAWEEYVRGTGRPPGAPDDRVGA